MFGQILFAIIIGVCAGIFTGLIPGVHINLVSLLLLGSSAFLLRYTNPIVLSIFIIAMATTHTFLDFIPSIFLGVPEADTALAILPGHRMLLEGKAFEAVKLTVIGSLLAVIFSIAVSPLLILVVPFLYEKIGNYIGWILLAVVIFMVMKEKSWNNRFWAGFIVITSGALGYIVLETPAIKEPLFPMLSGLFGVSMLLNSLSEKTILPKQRITEEIEIGKKELAKSISAGVFSGGLTSFFPGLGAAQASIIGSLLVGKLGTCCFLILLGAINTVNMLLSLITLYTLQKARNGAVLAILKLVESLDFGGLCLIMLAALVAAGLATFLAMYIVRVFSGIVEKVNYSVMNLSIIALIIGLVFVFSGWIGLFVLLISTMLGIIPLCLGIGKNHAMGCLLVPVIVFFIL
ncbi:tripartite tricarboxylate transporter permease [Candidatus Woesearchaeota archaeon]|nr:tripartite tricarboxylate transporter permease [Candidatus Woesearchaeota archaeon]